MFKKRRFFTLKKILETVAFFGRKFAISCKDNYLKRLFGTVKTIVTEIYIRMLKFKTLKHFATSQILFRQHFSDIFIYFLNQHTCKVFDPSLFFYSTLYTLALFPIFDLNLFENFHIVTQTFLNENIC